MLGTIRPGNKLRKWANCCASSSTSNRRERPGLCYNSLVMSSNAINTFLLPEKTVVNAKGDGPALDISTAASRVFLLTLDITNIIEQEAFDVSIYGSADG